MSIQILRPVTVKAKVTEGLKTRLVAERKEAMKLLEEDLQQLETQVKRAQLTATISPQQQVQLMQLVEGEKAKLADKKAQLQEEINAVTKLPLGSEIVQGQAQSIETVDVGSEYDLTVGTAIVVEDGKIIAVRKGEAL